MKNLLTETDAPYLGPQKDKRNEPLNVKTAVNKIAELKKILPEETEKIVFKNFIDLM